MYGFGWNEDAPKYKVGDRVQIIEDTWGSTFPVGEFGTIQKVLGHGVTVSRDGHDDYGWFFLHDEIAHAPAEQVHGGTANGGRYRVGDRVRTNGGFTFDPQIGHIVDADDRNYKVNVKSGYPGNDVWSYFSHEISPAFRPGDRVKLNKHSGVRACGERGTVSSVIGDNVSVRMDDASVHGTVVAFFHADNLDWEREEDVAPVTSAHDCAGRKDEQDNVGLWITGNKWTWGAKPKDWPSHQPCIVALISSGKPRPSSYPHVHASVEAATKEAERLARNNPGQEFAVYQRVAGRQCEVSYEMKEVA